MWEKKRRIKGKEGNIIKGKIEKNRNWKYKRSCVGVNR